MFQDISSVTSPDIAHITDDSSECIFQPQASTSRDSTQTINIVRPPAPRQANKRNLQPATQKADKILELIGEKLSEPVSKKMEDEFDVLGKYYANKMRKLPPTMQLIAEKLINDVYFQAQLGTLSVNSTIYTPTQESAAAQYIHNFNDDTMSQ